MATWSGNLGACAEIELLKRGEMPVVVKIIATGQGPYARDQRPPRGWSPEDLREIAILASRPVNEERCTFEYPLRPGTPVRILGRGLQMYVDPLRSYKWIELEIPDKEAV